MEYELGKGNEIYHKITFNMGNLLKTSVLWEGITQEIPAPTHTEKSVMNQISIKKTN